MDESQGVEFDHIFKILMRAVEERDRYKYALQSLVDYQFSADDKTGQMVKQYCKAALQAQEEDQSHGGAGGPAIYNISEPSSNSTQSYIIGTGGKGEQESFMKESAIEINEALKKSLEK